jgi:hypothetical protein
MCLSLRAGPNTFGLVENDEVGGVAGDGERWLDQTTRRLATSGPAQTRVMAPATNHRASENFVLE